MPDQKELEDALMEMAREIGVVKAERQLLEERIAGLERLLLDHIRVPDAHHPAIIKH